MKQAMPQQVPICSGMHAMHYMNSGTGSVQDAAHGKVVKHNGINLAL